MKQSQYFPYNMKWDFNVTVSTLICKNVYMLSKLQEEMVYSMSSSWASLLI